MQSNLFYLCDCPGTNPVLRCGTGGQAEAVVQCSSVTAHPPSDAMSGFTFGGATGPPSLDPYLHVACMLQSGPGAHSHRETLFGCSRAARACGEG